MCKPGFWRASPASQSKAGVAGSIPACTWVVLGGELCTQQLDSLLLCTCKHGNLISSELEGKLPVYPNPPGTLACYPCNLCSPQPTRVPVPLSCAEPHHGTRRPWGTSTGGAELTPELMGILPVPRS